MSAVTDRAEEFASVLREREEEIESLRVKVGELRVQEDEALSEALSNKPSSRPFGEVTSPAAKARRARVKAEKQLANLEIELPLLRQAATNASRVNAELRLVELERDLRAVESVQPAIWEKLRAAYVEVCRLYMTEAARITHERKQIDTAALEGAQDHGDLRDKWTVQTFPSMQVRPLPASLSSCLKQLERDVFEDRDFAAALHDRPESWVPSYIGNGTSGQPAAQWGPGVVIRRDDASNG